MMSDKDDVVLHCLTEFLDWAKWYSAVNDPNRSRMFQLMDKAIAIQKAQARVIQAARAYTTVTNKNDFPNRWDGLCSAIKNLDEKVTT